MPPRPSRCPSAARRLPLLAAATLALGVRAAATQHPHLASAVAFASSSRRPPSSSGPPPRRGGRGGSSGGKGRSRDPAGGGRPSPPASSTSSSSYAYYALNKPYQVMSQFSSGAEDGGGKLTLADVCGPRVPRDVYPVGRLDYDSEGLLVLTNDPAVNYKLLDPVRGHRREYWAQVEGEVTTEALRQLAAGGIELNLGKGKTHRTLPCEAARLQALSPPLSSSSSVDGEEAPLAAADPLPAGIGPREPPIRYRASIPTSWIRLRLTEGKNRQVRRMTAAVGFPTLRLVRWAIEDLTLEGLEPGEVVELSKQQMYKSLKLK